MSLHRKLTASNVLLGSLLFALTLSAQDPAADLVLVHGHILTVDANDSVAQAVAIRHGVIVKVATDAEVLEFAGNAPGVRIIDLHGLTATPGLIDTHAHIADGGVNEIYAIKLSDATSVAEIVARVKAKIALAKPGDWVTGSGWDEGKLAERRYVTAADLDAVLHELAKAVQDIVVRLAEGGERAGARGDIAELDRRGRAHGGGEHRAAGEGGRALENPSPGRMDQFGLRHFLLPLFV